MNGCFMNPWLYLVAPRNVNGPLLIDTFSQEEQVYACLIICKDV